MASSLTTSTVISPGIERVFVAPVRRSMTERAATRRRRRLKGENESVPRQTGRRDAIRAAEVVSTGQREGSALAARRGIDDANCRRVTWLDGVVRGPIGRGHAARQVAHRRPALSDNGHAALRRKVDLLGRWGRRGRRRCPTGRRRRATGREHRGNDEGAGGCAHRPPYKGRAVWVP